MFVEKSTWLFLKYGANNLDNKPNISEDRMLNYIISKLIFLVNNKSYLIYNNKNLGKHYCVLGCLIKYRTK